MSCSLFDGEMSIEDHNMLLSTSAAIMGVASDDCKYDDDKKKRMEEYICCLRQLIKHLEISNLTQKKRLYWYKTLSLTIDDVMGDEELGKDYLATVMFSPAGQFSIYRNNRHRILEKSVFQEAVLSDNNTVSKNKAADLKVHTMTILDDKETKSDLRKAFKFFNVGEGDDRRHVTIQATKKKSKVYIDTVKTFEYMGSKFLLVLHHDNNRKAPALVISESGEAYVGKRRYYKGDGEKVKTQRVVDTDTINELIDVLRDPKSACAGVSDITGKCPFSGEAVKEGVKFIPKMGKLYGYKSQSKARNSLDSILR